MTPVLEITDLHVEIGDAHVLRGVDLSVSEGETVGVVGESGCGKSTMLMAVVGLLPQASRVLSGSIVVAGQEIVGLPADRLRALRGRVASCVFQNARGALHPMMPVGDQVARAFRLQHGGSRSAARAEAVAMLDTAGLPDPAHLAKRYPHQLSGGQCQRAMIALALVSRPAVVLADEPTSGLDVTVQARVLETLTQRAAELGTTMVLVSHDIGTIRRVSDQVAVMYAGEIVEHGPREQVLDRPAHPYTQALLRSLDVSGERMHHIPGTVPDLRHPIHGCPFVPRCAHARETCAPDRPREIAVSSDHTVRCVLHDPALQAAAPAGETADRTPC
jgi:oligopeptide/dipeptide ABC transporter ATP-binding protein